MPIATIVASTRIW